MGKLLLIKYLFRTLFIKPHWVIEYSKSVILSFINKEKEKNVFADYNKYFHPFEEVLKAIPSNCDLDIRELIEELKSIELLESQSVTSSCSKWDASIEFAEMCYLIVRLLKPLSVVETGVARGVTSLYILNALYKNRAGHLYSIDMPLPIPNSNNIVGELVPNDIRSRWSLMLSSGVSGMKKLKKDLDEIDIFIHDSDHSYHNQCLEFRSAISWVRHNGIIISDDICNRAIEEVCLENKAKLMITRQSKDSSYVGIMLRN